LATELPTGKLPHSLVANLVAKYHSERIYTQSVGPTDPQARAGPADEPGWGDCPPGHISLPEASRRTGLTSEWLRRLAHTGELDSIQRQVGKRTRIWLAEEQVRELAKPENDQGLKSRRRPDRRSDATVPPGRGGDRDPVADERDRWRAEALRLREAGLRMAAAFDALTEADEHRSAAVQHIRAATDSIDHVLEKTREAVDHQNQALREFMIPTDMLEN
jgi:hypothetical protein